MYPKNYDVHSFVSDPGERYAPQRIGNVKDDGKIELVVTGKIDLWEMHKAQADQCDINNIVKRFQDGDISVLSRVQGNFVDVSNMPSDLRGVMDMASNIRIGFDKLPDVIKDKFADFNEFIDTAGSIEWFNKFNVESEVKEDVKE